MSIQRSNCACGYGIVERPQSAAATARDLELRHDGSNKALRDAAAGLHILDHQFLIEKIAGDGHCLFRSVATVFIKKIALMTDAEFELYFSGLTQRVDNMRSIPLDERFAAVTEICLGLRHGSLTRDAVIHTPASHSDTIVAFLRLLACEQNHLTNPGFAADIRDDLNVSELEYIKDMCEMSQRMHGTYRESSALAEALDMNICVMDACRISRAGIANGSNFYRARHRRMLPDDITLIFCINHYDVAIRK